MCDEEKVVHLSNEDLSQRMQIPVATLAQWRHKGVGPRFLKVGKYVRYRLVDVLAWEQAQIDKEDNR